MGRHINHFQTKGVLGDNSMLNVTYHYRGKDAGVTDFELFDSEGIVFKFKLQTKEDAISLSDYLKDEVEYEHPTIASTPSFETTGYALKIISNGNVIQSFYNHKIFDKGIDSFSYNSLRKAFPQYSSDDYYFVLFGLKENGMANETVQTIIDACLQFQNAVLVSGDLRVCRPMIQMDIANLTGFDNTTVSRAVKDVRIYTPHRNYSLDKNGTSLDFPSLFDEGIVIDGVRKSTIGIKVKIRALIENEDKYSPLTDEEIAEELTNYGYTIARRTVAKYRDYLGIPGCWQRRIK